MELSYGIVAKQALFRQEVGINMIKQASEQQQAVVSILDQLLVPAGSRGGNVNISA